MINFLNKNNKKVKKGFTLVELLIAMAIFMVIVTISMGSIISILDAGRKARALKSVMTNLNFTFETLSRDLKFGRSYYCGVATGQTWTPQNCTGSGASPESAITFVTSEGVPTIYRLNGTQLEKSTDYGATYVGITSPEIVIEDVKFFVFGSGTGDDAQPRVLILVRGYAGGKPTAQSRFVLQTTISQRGVDRLFTATPPAVYPPDDPEYTYCAPEWGTCSFSGVATVAYGALTSYYYLEGITNTTPCDNATFGDPIGVSKACYYKVTGP
jgi:prepilin-type N-terminal cleavage/methylation domain-containing protein